MGMNNKWYVLTLLFLSWLLASCDGRAPVTAGTYEENQATLSPVFETCYRTDYGPVLSETAQFLPGQTVQFATNAVLLFDLKHPPSPATPCLLAAGVALHLVEPAAAQKDQALYVNGHNVDPLLKDLFLDNQEEWGPPIAEAFIEEFTLVQYFANLGVRLHLTSGKLELLPYGAWLLAKTNPTASKHLTLRSFPVPESVHALQPLLGLALTPGEHTAIGELMPFSNIVLRVVGEGRAGIRPLNIVEILVNEGRLVLPKTTPPYDNLVPSPHPTYTSSHRTV